MVRDSSASSTQLRTYAAYLAFQSPSLVQWLTVNLVTSRSIPDSGIPLSCQLTFSHYMYVFINFFTLSNSEKRVMLWRANGFPRKTKKGKIPTTLWWHKMYKTVTDYPMLGPTIIGYMLPQWERQKDVTKTRTHTLPSTCVQYSGQKSCYLPYAD